VKTSNPGSRIQAWRITSRRPTGDQGHGRFPDQPPRAGIAVITRSIPAHSIHTVNETVAITDVDISVALLASTHTRPYTAD